MIYKSRIKVMTDSACDIPQDIETELDIRILPFPVTVGETGYLERVDFTNHEFYDILCKTVKIPVTSQLTMMQFEEEFEKVMSDGYNELIYVSINGNGSATNSNAHMAARAFYENHPDKKGEFKIHIVNSKTYTTAYGYPVIETAKKVRKGVSSAEIIAYLEDWFDSVEIYFAPYTLEFVKKSGRVPVAAAFVGELIGLRPIISIIDGETKIVEKVRGDKAVIPALLKYALNSMTPQTPYLLVKGMLEPEADELYEKAKRKFGYPAEMNNYIGAAIAINAGPKIVGLIVKGKNRSHRGAGQHNTH